jgi:hypothetical protein
MELTTCKEHTLEKSLLPTQAHSHSIKTTALKALPLLGSIRFFPLNTVTDTASRGTLSIHAGFQAATKVQSRTDYSRLFQRRS